MKRLYFVKKLFKTVVTLLLLSLLLTSCSLDGAVNLMQQIKTKDEQPIIEVFKGDYSKGIGQYSFSKNVSLNGKKYTISVNAVEDGNSYLRLQYKINDIIIDNIQDPCIYAIYDVYLADLNPDDNVVELFFSEISDNDYVSMRAFQFDGTNVTKIRFNPVNDYINEYYYPVGTSDINYHGITMNEDRSITFTAKTSSMGVWGLKKTFRLNGNCLEQDVRDYYEVDIMAHLGVDSRSYEDVLGYFVYSPEEYDMMLQGYALCYKDLGILKTGDYFTMLYDTNDGQIYVKTTNGKEGWIRIDRTMNNMDVSRLMFYLAG